jgi:hypothetical protein
VINYKIITIMKNNYLIVGLTLLIGGVSYGQSSNHTKPYVFDSQIKDAPITTIPGNTFKSGTRSDLDVFYTEDFDAGWNNWVPAIQAGNVNFELTSTGHQNSPGNTYQIPALATSTPAQWVVLDSDRDGADGAPEAATLTSPVIDLSGLGATSDQFIQMEFDQFFPEWENDECWIGVSTDGVNWIEKEINAGVGRNARPNPEHISWDITDAVIGNLSTVQIRFRWVGSWDYGWQIDNVQISEMYESDLALTALYRNIDGSFTYSKVPLNHSKEMVVGAIIKNIGHIEHTNIGFDYVIKNESNVEVASGSATTDLVFGNTDIDTIFWETGFTPDIVGVYTVEITATSDQMDDFESNNFQSDSYYEITDYIFARDYPEGEKVAISFFPSADPVQTAREAMFGNLFYFKQNDVVSALEVEIANNSNIIGESIYTIIGRVDTVNPEATWSFDAINNFTVSADDLGTMKIVAFPEGYNVNSSDMYFFMIGHYGWADENDPQDYFMRQGDIFTNNAQGRDAEGNNRGFFDRKAPIVRLRVNADEVSINEHKKAEFAFYPNPTQDELTLLVSANNEPITIVIRDMAGNLVQTLDLGTITSGEATTVDVSSFSSGMYMIEMISESNHSTKKFVKK